MGRSPESKEYRSGVEVIKVGQDFRLFDKLSRYPLAYKRLHIPGFDMQPLVRFSTLPMNPLEVDHPVFTQEKRRLYVLMLPQEVIRKGIHDYDARQETNQLLNYLNSSFELRSTFFSLRFEVRNRKGRIYESDPFADERAKTEPEIKIAIDNGIDFSTFYYQKDIIEGKVSKVGFVKVNKSEGALRLVGRFSQDHSDEYKWASVVTR
jgi:hypothetical protein